MLEHTALVVVDPQLDFFEGGALGVPGSLEILDFIYGLHSDYRHVALTRDWHPANHISFDEFPRFEDKSWPIHCVENTPGSEIHPRVYAAFSDAALFSKGMDPNVEQYSGWEGVNGDGETLRDWLDARGVFAVDVVGLALDYCVANTARDALHAGFDVDVLLKGTRPVAFETGALTIQQLTLEGAVFVG